MEPFEVLIKSQSDGVRFDLYYRPVLIDNIRLSPSDFEEFVNRLRKTSQGIVVDYAGYLEPDPARKPKPNSALRVTYNQVIETPHGVQLDLKIGEEHVRGLFIEKDSLPKLVEALRAERR